MTTDAFAISLPEPRDVWAERSVLGAVLTIERVPDELTPDMFWDPAHLALFEACSAMTANGDACTPVSVRLELMRRQHTGKLIDGVWLFDVMQGACMAAQVGYFAKQLREIATRRTVIAACSRALQAAGNPAVDPYDIAAQCSVDLAVTADRMDERPPPHIRDLDEFLDGPTEYDWQIPDLIERGDRLLITGGEGSGKSVMTRQIAVCAAAGVHPFTGDRVDPIRVLLVDLENGERSLRRHLSRLAEHARIIGRPIQPGLLRIESHMAGIDLTDVPDRAWLEGLCRSARPELLVIGPLYRMHASDMNDEKGARHLTRVIDGIRAEHGCSVLMETHSPHGYQGTRSLRPIGSSLFMRWPEFGYGLKAKSDDSEVFQFLPWRGPREERSFPFQLVRGGPQEWPWAPATNVYVPEWGS